MLWKINERRHVRVVRFTVMNLDAGVARELRDAMPRLGRSGLPTVLDLTGIEFTDSGGLGVLCALNAEYGPSGLALACPSKRLQAILARVPAARLPRCFESVEQAIDFLAGGQIRVTELLDDGVMKAPITGASRPDVEYNRVMSRLPKSCAERLVVTNGEKRIATFDVLPLPRSGWNHG